MKWAGEDFKADDNQLRNLFTRGLIWIGTPDEIAKAVLFLASDDSSSVNGIELFVEGGVTQVPAGTMLTGSVLKLGHCLLHLRRAEP